MVAHELCAVIPVYNHGATVAAVHARLAALGLPCVLVDDGSAPDCAAILDTLAALPRTHLVRRAANGGKGAAVQDGCAPRAIWATATRCRWTPTASMPWMTPPASRRPRGRGPTRSSAARRYTATTCRAAASTAAG